MSVVTNGGTSIANADPLIAQHAIHWVFSKEVYSPMRRELIDGWKLAGQTVDTVMYHFPADVESGNAIVAFRGSQTHADIVADIQLATPGAQPEFPRLQEAEEMITAFINDNPDVPIQLTGHSLGGYIARCTGQRLGLGIVTFNAAAPPSNPVKTGPNEADYHIVFDIVSAWQNPNTVRIDKGWRPSTASFNRLARAYSFTNNARKLLAAHSIDNFSNKYSGKVISADEEDVILHTWFNRLHGSLKKAWEHVIQTKHLPPV